MISFFVPAPTKPLLSNRPIRNHGYRQSLRNKWQKATAQACQQAGITKIETPVRCIAAIQRPDAWRIYDPNNWADTTKPMIDGLVNAGVLAEDNRKVLQGADHRHFGEGELGVWLFFTGWEVLL